MLLELVLNPMFNLIKSFLNVIPVITLPDSFFSFISNAFDMLVVGAYFLPLGHMAQAMALVFGFYLFKFNIAALNWAIRKVPTIS